VAEISMAVQKEIDPTAQLGKRLHQLLVGKPCLLKSERERFLMAYWDMLFDYHHGILVLFQYRCEGAAFALARIVVETLLRAHIAVKGTEQQLQILRKDRPLRFNDENISSVDEVFDLEGLFGNMLTPEVRGVLHSFAHSGASHVERRFTGDSLLANYSDDEIRELIRSATAAAFMLTSLTTAHLGLQDEWKKANELYNDYV
jgi:hypothetical protein